MRTLALIDVLTAAGFDVEVVHPESGRTDHVADQLRNVIRRNIGTVKRHFIPMPTSAGGKSSVLKRKVIETPTNLILITAMSQVSYAKLADGHLWLDFMDLWSEFAKRESSRRKGIARLTAAGQAGLLRAAESKAIRSARLVTAAGWTDAAILRAQGADVLWLPTALPDEDFRRIEDKPASAARTLGFIGNFLYWPNVDSYRLICEKWLPRLRASGWQIIVAGHSSESLGNPPPGVKIIGRVESVDDFYGQVAATLAPIRLGGGIKVKVLESLSRGTPVVGTDFAFEGFPPSCAEFFQTVPESGEGLEELSDLKVIDPASQVLDPFRSSHGITAVSKYLADW